MLNDIIQQKLQSHSQTKQPMFNAYYTPRRCLLEIFFLFINCGLVSNIKPLIQNILCVRMDFRIGEKNGFKKFIQQKNRK